MGPYFSIGRGEPAGIIRQLIAAIGFLFVLAQSREWDNRYEGSMYKFVHVYIDKELSCEVSRIYLDIGHVDSATFPSFDCELWPWPRCNGTESLFVNRVDVGFACHLNGPNGEWTAKDGSSKDPEHVVKKREAYKNRRKQKYLHLAEGKHRKPKGVPQLEPHAVTNNAVVVAQPSIEDLARKYLARFAPRQMTSERCRVLYSTILHEHASLDLATVRNVFARVVEISVEMNQLLPGEQDRSIESIPAMVSFFSYSEERPFRIRAVDCPQVNWTFNDRWEIKCYDGTEFDGMTLRFSGEDSPRWYQTAGLDFNHSHSPFYVYEDSKKNLSMNLKRLFGSRTPIFPDNEKMVYERQRLIVLAANTSPLVWAVLGMFVPLLQYLVDVLWTPINLLRHWYIKYTGIKQDERREFVRRMELNGDQGVVRELEGHNKREMGKYGKVGRVFVSYGAGCMESPHVPLFVKDRLHGRHVVYVDGWECDVYIYILFRKEFTLMESLAADLGALSVRECIIIAVYGDDGLVVLNTAKTGLRIMNMDISSCDSSQSIGSFELGGWFLSRLGGLTLERDYHCLVRQCQMPIILKDRFGKRLAKITPKEVFMGSGTVLTTMLNTLVNFTNISIALEAYMEDGVDFCRTFWTLGHEYAIDEVYTLEHIQFLHMSPMVCSDGHYHFSLNLGCILRSLGKVDGDLTAHMLGLKKMPPLNEAFYQYISGVIRGYKGEPRNPVLQVLRDIFVGVDVEVHTRDYTLTNELSHLSVLDESLYARYGDLSDLLYDMRKLQLGCVVRNPGLDRIFERDYGVKPK